MSVFSFIQDNISAGGQSLLAFATSAARRPRPDDMDDEYDDDLSTTPGSKRKRHQLPSRPIKYCKINDRRGSIYEHDVDMADDSGYGEEEPSNNAEQSGSDAGYETDTSTAADEEEDDRSDAVVAPDDAEVHAADPDLADAAETDEASDASAEAGSEADDEDEDEDEQSESDASQLSKRLSNLSFDHQASGETSFYDFDQTPRKIRFTIEPPEVLGHVSVRLAIARTAGWDECHVALLLSLYNRGREAIMPTDFHRSLYYMPDNLFVHHLHKPILDARNTTVARAESYLTQLLRLGMHLRSGTNEDGTPNLVQNTERMLNRFLGAYLKWTQKDTGLAEDDTAPIVALVHSRRTADAHTIGQRALTRVTKLATKHLEIIQRQWPSEEASQLVPTIYAIMAIGGKLMLSAYNTKLGHKLHHVVTYDMMDCKQDVWNSFALALIACHGRDVQIELAKQLGVQKTSSRMEVDAEDPDV